MHFKTQTPAGLPRDVNKPALVILYSHPWNPEYERVVAGETPSHRLFYALELAQLGHRVVRVPEPARLHRFLHNKAFWLAWSSIWAIIGIIRGAGCALAVQEDCAPLLLALRRLKLLRAPVVVTNIALLKTQNIAGIRNYAWRWLLVGADTIISYARAQIDQLEHCFDVPRAKCVYVSLGITSAFFDVKAARQKSSPRVVVATGTPGRDYQSLIDAAEHIHGDVEIYCYHDVWERLQNSRPVLPRNVRLHRGNLSYRE